MKKHADRASGRAGKERMKCVNDVYEKKKPREEFPYFEPEWSMASGSSDRKTQLLTIASRYVGMNPPTTFQVRAISTEQFRQGEDEYWILELTEKLGAGTDGYALVSGMIMSEAEKTIDLTVSCYSPVRLYLNDEEKFQSTFADENNKNLRHTVEVHLMRGKNIVTVLCRRTAAGFGCRLLLPQTVILSPLAEQRGQAGWVWSDLIEQELKNPNLSILDCYKEVHWNPRGERASAKNPTPQQRIFPEGEGYCIAWCKLRESYREKRKISPVLLIDSFGKNEIYIDGQCKLCCETGQYRLSVSEWKSGDVHIKSDCSGYTYGAIVRAEGVELVPPGRINGTEEIWVYAGCFDNSREWNWREFSNLFGMPAGHRWYLDTEKLCLRTFFEGSFKDKDGVVQGGSAFGRWDYPLGVTLFGLLKTGSSFDKQELREYVNSHMKCCTHLYTSAILDKEMYGYPAYGQNLVRMHCLDDCGSMGMAMLECYKICPDERYMEIAMRIKDFMINKLSKLEDGTFYRPAGSANTVSTIWADDLYMSAPFLRCLYDITGDTGLLKLAARQFLNFSRYLFLPDVNLFSHVYDLDRKCPTGIHWGRGNGWVLFSLAYFLDGLIERAELQKEEKLELKELRKLFLTLSASCRKLQGEKGLWHQVLTDTISYEEASCTAMFIYAFCKGITNGWYGEEAPLYMEAAEKGFQGLTEYCIDRNGSVYAVCKGSRFSFTKEYYRDELFWVMNDNHGIGIVLLAGNELLRVQEKEKSTYMV